MLMFLKLRGDISLTLRQGSVCCWAMVLTKRVTASMILKVIRSRDVVFDEASTPGIQKEKETTVKYVELEIEEEPIKETAITNPPDSAAEQISVHEESTASNLIVSESGLRRSTRNKQQPNRYSYNFMMVSTARPFLSS